MGVKERKARDRADVRERIIDAAREMFARDGVEAVTMRAIADRIEYSAPVIYSHFRDKQALLQEICYRDFRALAQTFAKIGRIPDPIERLRRIGITYVDFALENPAQFRFMFMTPKPATDDERILSTMENPEENAYAFLRQTVADGIAAERFREDLTDVDELAQLCWASAHGIVALQIAKGEDTWLEWRDARSTAQRLIDASLAGITRSR
jgi:AcrR family transcriptional regulator